MEQLEMQLTTNLNTALSMMESGAKIARKDWVDQHLAVARLDGDTGPGTLYLVTPKGSSAWHCTEEDAFADDWVIVK